MNKHQQIKKYTGFDYDKDINDMETNKLSFYINKLHPLCPFLYFTPSSLKHYNMYNINIKYYNPYVIMRSSLLLLL